MRFLAKSVTENNNLLLEGIGEIEPLYKETKIFLNKREVGFVFETIASVKKPFYLAKAAEGIDAKTLVGKTLLLVESKPKSESKQRN